MGGIKSFAIKIFVLLPLILGIVFSQEVDEALNRILSIIVVVGIILGLVLALAYLGGVLKFGKIGIRGETIVFVLYSILIIFIFVLPFLQKYGIINIKIFPDKIPDDQIEPFKLYQLPQPVCLIFKNLAVDENIGCYMPAVIFFFILPFTAIYAITWAFLVQIKIFEGLEKRIEGLIAFIIAFMTIPMGTFLMLIAFWFSTLGAFAIAVFVAMFLAGTFLRGYGYIGSRYYEEQIKIHSKAFEAEKKLFYSQLASLHARITGSMTWDDVENEINRLFNVAPKFAPEIRRLLRFVLQQYQQNNNPPRNSPIGDTVAQNIKNEITDIMQQLR